jgi:hypothetical protein
LTRPLSVALTPRSAPMSRSGRESLWETGSRSGRE